ncbi:hypothetical protein A8990_10256 [Paenibacillus taihuensis]|uniref:Uncharacterized protein n=1 Tax=Paenibacillus taihuensis TaxID=1156355 RepID=A0A3D9SDP0_9BACL|nr:hypothetical protein [Paenibacillus taihuensis]REE92972.1 hypothetical protein A8990_10256 [Paenibacillus taihuensis]
MKRYWFSILLVVFIIGCVSTYYVSAAARSFPEYKLLTVSGDDNEAKAVVLEADSKKDGRLEITAKGSLYFQERSFFDSFLSNEMFKYSPELQLMMKKHKNFMRGKKTYNGFYQDGQVLAYADVKSGNDYNNRNYKLNVSVLDLKTKDKTSFTAALPKQELYSWVNTADVQVKGQTLHLITYNMNKAVANDPNRQAQEIHDYTIDLSNKSIADDRVLFAEERTDDGKVISYNIIPSSQITAPSESLVYQQTTLKVAKDKDGNEFTPSMEQVIYTYNLETGKSQEVPAFKSHSSADSAQSEAMQVFFSGGQIVEVRGDEAGTTINLYGMKDQAIRNFTIPTGPAANTLVYGDRLYMTSKDGDAMKLYIADLKQGKVIYTGAIDINEQSAKRTELLKQLHVYSMYLAK